MDKTTTTRRSTRRHPTMHPPMDHHYLHLDLSLLTLASASACACASVVEKEVQEKDYYYCYCCWVPFFLSFLLSIYYPFMCCAGAGTKRLDRIDICGKKRKQRVCGVCVCVVPGDTLLLLSSSFGCSFLFDVPYMVVVVLVSGFTSFSSTMVPYPVI